jgi:hypothetical protein
VRMAELVRGYAPADPGPHLLVPGRGDLQADLHRADTDR